MSLPQIILLAFALAMDAFAVSVGSCTRKRDNFHRHALATSLSFGLFQAGMPLLGWSLGRASAGLLQAIDHWIAFGLLAAIGAKMVWEGLHADSEDCDDSPVPFSWKTLMTLSVATSIDAGAVGISLSLIESPILYPALMIGVITFALSWLGHHFGRILGERFGKGAEVFGGLVLIGIGGRILFEHWTL